MLVGHPTAQAKFFDPDNQQEEIHQLSMLFASIHEEIANVVSNQRLKEVVHMFTRGCAAPTRVAKLATAMGGPPRATHHTPVTRTCQVLGQGACDAPPVEEHCLQGQLAVLLPVVPRCGEVDGGHGWKG